MSFGCFWSQMKVNSPLHIQIWMRNACKSHTIAQGKRQRDRFVHIRVILYLLLFHALFRPPPGEIVQPSIVPNSQFARRPSSLGGRLTRICAESAKIYCSPRPPLAFFGQWKRGRMTSRTCVGKESQGFFVMFLSLKQKLQSWQHSSFEIVSNI